MSRLSNPSPGSNQSQNQLVCRPVHKSETHAALRLILGSRDDTAILDFLQFCLKREIDLGGIWIAQTGGSMLWALLPVTSPGRTMLLLGPGRIVQEPSYAASRLIEEVLDHYRGRGVHLAQALIDPEAADLAALYRGAGFNLIANLLYLQVQLSSAAAAVQLPANLGWETYNPASHRRFASTILASYRESMDCPKLSGLRDIEDIVAGHKATGEFRPDLWFLLNCRGQGCGVVLLSPAPDGTVELVYLGLAPEARGRGLGDILMSQALGAASGRGFSALTLAVDAANVPALQLYFRHGMQQLARKQAFMCDLRQRTSPLHAGQAGGYPRVIPMV